MNQIAVKQCMRMQAVSGYCWTAVQSFEICVGNMVRSNVLYVEDVMVDCIVYGRILKWNDWTSSWVLIIWWGIRRMKWMLTVWCFAVYQKCNNSEYSNYQVISMLSAAYKFLPKIVLYIVTPYVEKIIGNYHFGFLCIDHDGSHIVYWRDCGEGGL